MACLIVVDFFCKKGRSSLQSLKKFALHILKFSFHSLANTVSFTKLFHHISSPTRSNPTCSQTPFSLTDFSMISCENSNMVQPLLHLNESRRRYYASVISAIGTVMSKWTIS